MQALSAAGVRAQAAPGPHPQRRHHPRAPPAPQALSFQVQPLGNASTTYTGGAAPSCPWPQAGTHATPNHQPHGVLASMLGGTAQAAQQERATLPPEMERLMRFTDGPGAEEQSGDDVPLLARLWRYQGP